MEINCTRHTAATEFARLTTGDLDFCQSVLGHKDVTQTLRYVHLFKMMQRQVKMQVQIQNGLVLGNRFDLGTEVQQRQDGQRIA